MIRLAYPVYLELLAGVVAGVIDLFWVARLGGDAVAAVTVATNLENLLFAAMLAISIGLTVRLAGTLTAGDDARARGLVRAGASLWLAVATVVGVGGFCLRGQVAELFLTDPEAIALARDFLAVSMPGIAVFFAQNTVDAVFKGDGDTRTPMRTALLSTAILLVLDPILIFGWAGAPALGVTGAAIATVVARGLALAVSLIILTRNRRWTAGPADRTGAARAILTVGVPAAADFAVRMSAATVIVGLVGTAGVAMVAAYGIGMKICMFATMSFYAIRQAATILTARTTDPAAINALGRRAALLGGGAGATAAVVVAIFGAPLARLFSTDQTVIDATAGFLTWMAPYLAAIGATIAITGVLIGTGRANLALRVTLAGTGVQLATGYLLSRGTGIGITGVWIGTVVGATLQCLLLTLTLIRMHRRTTNRENGTTTWAGTPVSVTPVPLNSIGAPPVGTVSKSLQART